MSKIKATRIEEIEDAQYGDLIFFTPSTSLFSRLIPPIDGSKFSHVAFYLGRRYSHNLFIESMDFYGIRIKIFEKWRNYRIYRPLNIVPMPISKVLEDLGKPYDRRKIIELLRHKILGTPFIADDDKALICSEAVNKWYNYKLTEKGNATPATIFHNLEL